MRIKTRVTQVVGALARPASRLPWRKQMALAVLFIGTPFITGDMEYVVLNLVGLGIGALLFGKVTQSRRQAETARVRGTTTATVARRTR